MSSGRQEEPMLGRQGSKENLELGRRLGRGVWVSYLSTGAALAILRVALLVWAYHRYVSGTAWSGIIDYYLVYCGLYTEHLLANYTALGAITEVGPDISWSEVRL
jgi:hypothetical protein